MAGLINLLLVQGSAAEDWWNKSFYSICNKKEVIQSLGITNKWAVNKKSRLVAKAATPELLEKKVGLVLSLTTSHYGRKLDGCPAIHKAKSWQESSQINSASCCCMAGIRSSWLGLGRIKSRTTTTHHSHVYCIFWGSVLSCKNWSWFPPTIRDFFFFLNIYF